MTGAAKGTVLKLLANVGAACKRYHDEHVRNVQSSRVQCDEIWSFCYAKERNIPEDLRGVAGVGDVWTWTGICADTKLMISYHVGLREPADALRLMGDLRSRLANKVQLTTGGYRPYLVAVNEAFGADVDYAMLKTIYSNPGNAHDAAHRPSLHVLQLRADSPNAARYSSDGSGPQRSRLEP